MNTKATPHLEFAPPAQPGAGRAWILAGVAHALLFLALGLATAWKTQPQTVQAEAELWSAVPAAAAPRLQEPPPEPEPEPVPETQPTPPAKPAPPPPPAPDPALEARDAQIALEKKKQLEKKKEAEKAQKLKAEKEKAAKEKAKAEKAKAEKEKAETKRKELEKEKLAKEKKAQEEKERDKKKAAEKADAAKFEALRADAHKDQMKNIQKGLAGASGGENASGTALKSSGPSSSYGGKIVREILDKTTNADSSPGALTVKVFVRANASGEILSSRVLTSSGSRAFDDSVIRGIQKMERVPKDVDGKIPEILIREGLELTVSR